nr:hypothetical protein Iba_chr12aCG5870 [Ipomoea batatas]
MLWVEVGMELHKTFKERSYRKRFQATVSQNQFLLYMRHYAGKCFNKRSEKPSYLVSVLGLVMGPEQYAALFVSIAFCWQGRSRNSSGVVILEARDKIHIVLFIRDCSTSYSVSQCTDA